MVMKEDIVLAVSNSGETEEILKLLPHFKLHGVKLVVMTGKPEFDPSQSRRSRPRCRRVKRRPVP